MFPDLGQLRVCLMSLSSPADGVRSSVYRTATGSGFVSTRLAPATAVSPTQNTGLGTSTASYRVANAFVTLKEDGTLRPSIGVFMQQEFWRFLGDYCSHEIPSA